MENIFNKSVKKATKPLIELLNNYCYIRIHQIYVRNITNF